MMNKNNNSSSKKVPAVEIQSLYIYPTVELLGNESPDDEFVFYTKEGAESFCGGKSTYGFRFEILFDADVDEKVGLRSGFAGPVEIDLCSEERQIRHHYASFNAPCKLLRRHKYGASYGDGSYLFVAENSEEVEDLFENGCADATGHIDLRGFTVLNEDYGVRLDISADFNMKDGETNVEKDALRVCVTEVLPIDGIIVKAGK